MPVIPTDIEMLRQAQPAWRADNLGVRGNAVDFQKEQAQVDWPKATLTHHAGRDQSVTATAGSPEGPRSIPAT